MPGYVRRRRLVRSFDEIYCLLQELTYLTALNNLQGALGKTAGRSYKAAPRQLLQVDSGSGNGVDASGLVHAHISKADVGSKTEGEGAAEKAAEIGHEALRGHVSVGSRDRSYHNLIFGSGQVAREEGSIDSSGDPGHP